MADRMMMRGPTKCRCPLNSHRAELHDETRGVKGAFKKAVTALAVDDRARKRHPERGNRNLCDGLIFDRNYREIDGVLRFRA